MRKIILTPMVLFFMLNLSVMADPITIESATSNWKLWTSTNSKLPHNIVTSICMDGVSRIWIGTDAGMAILKDTIDTVLKAANGLPSDKVSVVYVDPWGWTWVGTSDKGIGKFKLGSAWGYYSTVTTPALPNNYVTSVDYSNATTFWVGTQGKGVAQIQGTTITNYFDSNSPLSSNWITCIKVSNKSSSNPPRWIGTNAGGLYKNDNSGFTNYTTSNSQLPHNLVRTIFIDQIDRLFIGTDGGYAIFDPSVPSWIVKNKTNTNGGLKSNRVQCILPDFGDNTWVGTDQGLFRFDGTDWFEYTSTTTNGGLPSNYINAILQDDSMFIWVATNGGLTKLKQRTFSHCTKSLLCSGDTTSFILRKSASYNVTYQWQVNLGGGWSNISDGDVYAGAKTTRLNLSGVRTDMDSAKFRCISTFSTIGKDTSNTIQISVASKPPVPTVEMFGTQIYSSYADFYQWYYESYDIKIEGATSQLLTPGYSTKYYVEVANANGCKSKSASIFAEGNALQESSVKTKLYPSPSSGTFTISGNTGQVPITRIAVYSVDGKAVYDKPMLLIKGDFSEEVTLNVPDGVYYVKLTSGSATIAQKILIQK